MFLRKLLKQRSAKFSYLIMILLCFPYKPLLTFLLTGASHVHFIVAIFCLLEHVLIAFIVCEVLKHFLASFFFYCTFIYYIIFKNLNKVFGYRPLLPLYKFYCIVALITAQLFLICY